MTTIWEDFRNKVDTLVAEYIEELKEENQTLKDENARLVQNLAEYKNEITDLKEEIERYKQAINKFVEPFRAKAIERTVYNKIPQTLSEVWQESGRED